MGAVSIHRARIGGHLVGIVAGEHDVIGTDRELLRLSLGLLTGQDGQPSGGVGVLRPPGDAAVQFVAAEDGSA
jgi:hypothetical protein